MPVKAEETPPSTPEKAKKHRASKTAHSPKLKMPENKDESRRHKHSSHRESSLQVLLLVLANINTRRELTVPWLLWKV